MLTTLRIDPDTSWPENAMPTADLVTVVGNLVDNAFDAVGELPGERVVSFAAGASDGRATLTVTVRTRVALPLVPPVLGLDRAASIPIEASSAQRVSRLWGAS